MKKSLQSLSSRDFEFSIANMLWVTILYKLTLYVFFFDIDPYNPFIGFITFLEFISLAAFIGLSTLMYYLRYNRIVFFNAKYQLFYIVFGSQSFLLLSNLKSESFIVFLFLCSILLPLVVSILTNRFYWFSRRDKSNDAMSMTFNIRDVAGPLWRLYLKALCVAPVFVIIIAAIMLLSSDGTATVSTEAPTNEQFIKYIIGRSVDYALFITTPLWVITYILAVFRINTIVVKSLSTQIATIVILIISYIAASFMFEGSTKAVAIYLPPTLFLLLQGLIYKIAGSRDL